MTTTSSFNEFITSRDATAARILSKNMYPVPGALVGVRLNLNILKSTGVAVQTMHQATNTKGYKENKGFYRGKVISYAETVLLKNAYFNVDQIARDAISSGSQNKYAMASVDGNFISTDSTGSLNGLEIRFNPHNSHLFTDLHNNAVRCAEYVVVTGHRAYAFGLIQFHDIASAPLKVGQNFSSAQLLGGTVYRDTKELLLHVPICTSI